MKFIRALLLALLVSTGARAQVAVNQLPTTSTVLATGYTLYDTGTVTYRTQISNLSTYFGFTGGVLAPAYGGTGASSLAAAAIPVLPVVAVLARLLSHLTMAARKEVSVCNSTL